MTVPPRRLAIVALVTALFLPGTRPTVPLRAAGVQSRPSRIVSLIPAVTEMLFVIGAGPQVVAVSSFDEYPPQVKMLPRVGALLDPDLERILSLRPDLVVVYHSQADLRRQLERAGVPMYDYKHAGLADVLETMQAVGARVGRAPEAAAAVKKIQDHLARIRASVQSLGRPRTLLVFSRDALALRGIYASGGIGFLDDMLELAGGENVFDDVRRQAVQATTELILARRPDVIVEFRSGELSEGLRSKEMAAWNALAAVPAVKNRRIAILTDQRTVVPGPRVAEGTELIARIVHPEAFGK